jgi:hypothetical protein
MSYVRPPADAFDNRVNFARTVDGRPLQRRELEGAFEPLAVGLAGISAQDDRPSLAYKGQKTPGRIEFGAVVVIVLRPLRLLLGR